MLKFNRKNLALLVAVLFLVTAPFVILWTAGFRYQPKKHRLERIGFIEVTSVPSGASVLINGETKGQTPYVDTTIIPGEYSLDLAKPGYYPLKRKVAVLSGQATLMRDLQLWRSSLPELIEKTGGSASISPTGAIVAWHDTEQQLILTTVPLSSKNRELCHTNLGDNVMFEWNTSGESLLALIENENHVLRACTLTANGNLFTLPRIGHVLLRASWTSFNNDQLLMSDESGNYTMSVTDGKLTRLGTENVPFTLSGSRLLEIVATKDGAELHSTSLLKLPLQEKLITEKIAKGSYAFLHAPESLVAARETRTNLVEVFRTRSLERLNSFTAKNLVFSPMKNSLHALALTDFEISFHDLDADTSKILTRLSIPIEAVAWHPSEKAIFFAAGGNVNALSLDVPNETTRLAAFDQVFGLWVDKRGDTLFISAKKDGAFGLWKFILK